jgi:NAD(P)-dependent dehydrogenase (short-subunit alcohol dehydrogenase family)
MSFDRGFSFPLTGAVVLITGAASGIGRAAALMALKSGAKVAAVDIDKVGLVSLEAEVGSDHAGFITDVMDVTDARNVVQCVQRVRKALGVVSGLVCSAGLTDEKPFLEISPDLWNRIVQLNLAGTFYVAQTVVRDMVANKIPGSIVTISSALGVAGRVKGAHYSASKAGVIGLTKSMALELAMHQIRVNCVAPGGVDTPLMRRVLNAIPGAEAQGLSRIPLGRFGQPDDLASTICFLLSDLAGWTTGQTLHVNGGSLLV